MIKLLIDFVQFLYTIAPLFVALGALTLFAVLLSKSIKRHAAIYYTVFAVPFALVAIPFIGRLLGIEMFNFGRIPFLGGLIRDYIHAGTLGFPLLIIIMYMGALSPKKSYVKKLVSIRGELSILSGFPILTHSLIRVTNNFPNALRFFTDNDGYMENAKMANTLGAGVSNFSFVLGILMLALFLPLWVTSFDSVRKWMGSVRWKKLQRWSYVLYAMLFIHALGIQLGFMLNPRVERPAPAPVVAAVAPAADSALNRNTGNRENRGSQSVARNESAGQGNENTAQSKTDSGNRTATGRGGHQPSIGFADIKVDPQTRRYIHIASLLLIFGSYLYLRLRKAKLV
jgi:DMSO/TMAO reductase YedYZ heme-binding membrane subunit